MLAAVLAVAIIAEVTIRESPHLVALFGAGFVPIITVVFGWGAYDGSTASGACLLGVAAGAAGAGLSALTDMPGAYTSLPHYLDIALFIVGLTIFILVAAALPSIHGFTRYGVDDNSFDDNS